jgi:serine/threonine protein kinase
MDAEDNEVKKDTVPRLEDMAPTLDAMDVDLSAIRSRYSSVKVGITIDGKYRVEKEIGRGGMGSVYRAIQLSMNRPVAIKTLKPELLDDDIPVKRFFREARSASHLNHPNIVRVFDFGVDEELAIPYLVMELLEGRTLTQIVEEKPLEERRAANLMAQVAKALTDAHSHAVVHRDLKPDNILVVQLPDGDEHIKVLDFGLAKVWDTDGGESLVTQSGHISGTPAFMSPEQIVGEPVDYRADLYSLGCVLYYVMVGSLAFEGEEALSIVIKQVNEPAPSLQEAMGETSRPSEAVSTLYDRLLSKDPSERPTSTTGVARYLSAIARNEVPNAELLELPMKGLTAGFSNSDVPGQGVQTSVGARPEEVRSPQKGKKDLFYLASGPAFMILLGILLAQGLAQDSGESIESPNPVSSTENSTTVNGAQHPSITPAVSTGKKEQAKSPSTQAANLSTEEANAYVKSLISDQANKPKTMWVRSIPAGVALYREATSLGTSPLHLKNVKSKEPWILRAVHPDFDTLETTIDKDSPKEITLKLKPRTTQKPILE